MKMVKSISYGWEKDWVNQHISIWMDISYMYSKSMHCIPAVNSELCQNNSTVIFSFTVNGIEYKTCVLNNRKRNKLTLNSVKPRL
jgi:hypothetical protein